MRFAGQLTATGGVPPYRFLVASGLGLSLSPNGAITGKPTTLGTTSLTVRVADSGLPTSATAARKLAFAILAPNGQSTVYVANANNNSVTEYAPGATGNAAPLATIAGPATQVAFPDGIAVSPSRRVCVANGDAGSVVEFAPGSNGKRRPGGHDRRRGHRVQRPQRRSP
jgi:hypothetical protein